MSYCRFYNTLNDLRDEVYIPTDCSQSATTNIGYNFDDNNDLDLYEVSK